MSTVSQQQQPAAAGSIVKLVEVLQQIDTSAPKAKINETSIDDNNGGRIIL
ncbi:MAG TPA: hypothetical protein VIH90_02660 [Candidatus Saccharimonadales bacterium]